MKGIKLLIVLFVFGHLIAKAQLNNYVINVECSPLANSWQSPLGFTFLSLKTKIPYKLDFSFGDGAPNDGYHYSSNEDYKYSFVYLKPGFIIKAAVNEKNKSIFCIAVNLNLFYMNHDFRARIEDNLGSSRVINLNKEIYSWGYQVELIRYKNIGNSMFNIHYGAGYGITFKDTDAIAAFVKTSKGSFYKTAPGIGNGLVVFLGIGTRIFKLSGTE